MNARMAVPESRAADVSPTSFPIAIYVDERNNHSETRKVAQHISPNS